MPCLKPPEWVVNTCKRNIAIRTTVSTGSHEWKKQSGTLLFPGSMKTTVTPSAYSVPSSPVGLTYRIDLRFHAGYPRHRRRLRICITMKVRGRERALVCVKVSRSYYADMNLEGVFASFMPMVMVSNIHRPYEQLTPTAILSMGYRVDYLWFSRVRHRALVMLTWNTAQTSMAWNLSDCAGLVAYPSEIKIGPLSAIFISGIERSSWASGACTNHFNFQSVRFLGTLVPEDRRAICSVQWAWCYPSISLVLQTAGEAAVAYQSLTSAARHPHREQLSRVILRNTELLLNLRGI
ncbi:hypothetical protein V8B97DRAFT_2112306 [Scleroderma yunnanense]